MNMIVTAIQEGGIWMYPIILTMVVAFAIAAERIFALMRFNMDGSALMAELQKSILGNQIDNASKTCQGQIEQGKALPVVLHAGLKAANRTEKEIEKELERASLEIFPKLNVRTPFLPMLANIATLSGLLGTIIGLIQAFDAVATAPADQKQTLLAKGISVAMYTTAGGLVVAIPVLVMNSIVVAITTKIMDDIDLYAAQALQLLRARKRNLKESAK
jgi:biopolymer transport protein ExbB/TolQ